MKLKILGEADTEFRKLERRALSGDSRAQAQLSRMRIRIGLDDPYLKKVRAFCVSDFPAPPSQFANRAFWDNKHVVCRLLLNQLKGARDRDFQIFEMEDSLHGVGGMCFVDRNNKTPDQGIELEIPSNDNWQVSQYSSEEQEDFQTSWNVKIVPVDGWLLTIYHFGSIEDAREHYGKLWLGTQRRIAYRKLESGTIGLQNKNPPDFPTRNGLPFKSNRIALNWAVKKIPHINAVGSLQGPEVKVNRQFLFVKQ